MTDSELSGGEPEDTFDAGPSTQPSPPVDAPHPWLQTPLPAITLGAWGFAHLTGAWSADGRARLVGRELELVRLLQMIDQTLRSRAPMLVTVSGPAGMGKTRLIDETLVLASVSGFERRSFTIAALPQDPSGALIARLLRVRFGLDEATDPDLQRELLLSRVGEVLNDDRVGDVCFFLGKLLGIEIEPTPFSKCLNRDAFHAELALESILCELISADAEQAPLCLAFEDLQHADAESLALLGTVLDTLLDTRRGRLLALCSGQPDFFASHPHFTRFPPTFHEHLELRPLELSDVRTLMREMLGPELGNDDALGQRAMKMGLGNPGLIESFTRQLWHTGALTGEVGTARPSFHPQHVPHFDTWDERPEVLQTRISSLSDQERRILETAAVVGTACWRGLLARLTSTPVPDLECLDRNELDAGLTRLAAAGHLLELPESRFDGDTEYVFRRPEEREYLLRQSSLARRRACHRATADWLGERRTDDSGSEVMALEAHHLAEAGSCRAAATAYLEAGTQARREGSRNQSAEYLSAASQTSAPKTTDAASMHFIRTAPCWSSSASRSSPKGRSPRC